MLPSSYYFFFVSIDVTFEEQKPYFNQPYLQGESGSLVEDKDGDRDLFLLDFSTLGSAPIQYVPYTEPHPTPSPINPEHVTKNNEIHNSMRFIQVYSRQRNLNPKQVQDSTSNPENEIAVPENLPQPASEFENEVNTVP